MKRLTCSLLSLLAATGIVASEVSAENLFAPLNKVYDVDAKSNAYGIRRQGTGNMNTNLLSEIFNPGRRGVSQVPLQMLDGSQSTLQFRRQQGTNVDGIQIVSGVVDGEGHNMATLVNDGGELRGRIWKDGQLYRLRGDRSGEYSLSEIKNPNKRVGTDTIDIGKEKVGNQASSEQANIPLAPEGEPIDIAIMITNKAIKDLGGEAKAESELRMLIAETNNIFRQSGITEGNLLRLVGIVPVPFRGSDKLLLDLGYWKSQKWVMATRNKLGADLVSFITAPKVTRVCGVGFIGPEPGSPGFYPEIGYSLSALECVVADLTFVHEVGHNLGARHDRYVDGTKGINHGYVNMEKKWRTVMAYSNQCYDNNKLRCPEIPYFSNPGLEYQSKKLGVSGDIDKATDNASSIKRNIRLIAAYRARADANTSSSGKNGRQGTSSLSRPAKVGGIILEPASQSQSQAKPRDGKERKIKW